MSGDQTSQEQMDGNQMSRDQTIKHLEIKWEWRSNVQRSNENGDQLSGDQMRMEIKCPQIE